MDWFLHDRELCYERVNLQFNQNQKLINSLLPSVPFFNPCKYQKTIRFPDVFSTLCSNELNPQSRYIKIEPYFLSSFL